jgi:hypothetical protein
MHRIMLLLARMCLYTLDHAKPELEEPTEQAQAEEATNTELTKGKSGASHQLSLAFVLFTILCYICLCIKFVGVDWTVDAL